MLRAWFFFWERVGRRGSRKNTQKEDNLNWKRRFILTFSLTFDEFHPWIYLRLKRKRSYNSFLSSFFEVLSLLNSKTIIIIFNFPSCQNNIFISRCLITAFYIFFLLLVTIETCISFWWIHYFMTFDCPLIHCYWISSLHCLFVIFLLELDYDLAHFGWVGDLPIPWVLPIVSWISLLLLKIAALAARF